jgi:CRP-like cAMP-binding protein
MRPEIRTIGHVQRVLLLKKGRFTGNLPASDLALVVEYLREHTYAAGEVLLREGQPVPAVHFIADGTVRLQRGGVDVARAEAGTELGGMEMLARADSALTVIAETEVRCLELSAESNGELLDEHFGIFHRVLQQNCRQIIALTRRLPDATASLPPPRVAPPPGREMDLVERIFFLRQAPPFARSSINALAELSRALTEVRFEPGTVLWSEGYSARGVFLVVSGRVTARSPRFGFEMQVGAGQPLGILEAFAQVPRWYEATIVEPTVALSGDVETFVDVLEDNVEMAMDYLAVIARWTLSLSQLLIQREGLATLAEYGITPILSGPDPAARGDGA